MGLPITDNEMKTLNEDVQLVSDEYGKYDLDMHNGDYINTVGLVTLRNACIIAIMTRLNEIKNETYQDFGCRVHDLIKGNKTKMLVFNLESDIDETLNNMRRIKEVNSLEITEDEAESYLVEFSVTSINDEIVKGSVSL